MRPAGADRRLAPAGLPSRDPLPQGREISHHAAAKLVRRTASIAASGARERRHPLTGIVRLSAADRGSAPISHSAWALAAEYRARNRRRPRSETGHNVHRSSAREPSFTQVMKALHQIRPAIGGETHWTNQVIQKRNGARQSDNVTIVIIRRHERP